MIMAGIDRCHDDKVITVFSSSNYCNRCGNQGGLLQLTFGESGEDPLWEDFIWTEDDTTVSEDKVKETNPPAYFTLDG